MSCNLIFCLHNHQPVGNFEHVLEWAFKQCYKKTIDILYEYPEFRFAVHHSGCLLEWIDTYDPTYLEKIAGMVERNQLEIIGGGFYEPIFSIIRESDIRDQIRLMQEFCEEKFRTIPRGFWTAERVWDPEIPRLVSNFGLQYTLLDDNHFRYAGIGEDLHGYYITERLDSALRVFPIDKFLRYSIPFKPPEETIQYFRERADRYEDPAYVYGDDGEKFGVWPGTYDWVFKEKWLVKFVETILNNDWITLAHPSEYIASHNPLGRVYLTQGSYFEMSEWALPSQVALKLTHLHKELEHSGRSEEFYPFLKGGVWNNFLIKYPESNAINKRTILLSKEIEKLERDGKTGLDDAKRELYRSECNCAYWHGVFGGIYLNNLRDALYERLLRAERLMLAEKKGPSVELIESDFWNEGGDQLLVRTSNQSTLIVPSHGGMVSELGLYGHDMNIMNVVARRNEAYHEQVLHAEEAGADSGDVKSIHNIPLEGATDLKQYLCYDTSRRYSFKEMFFYQQPGADELMFMRTEVLDCGVLPYEYSCVKKSDAITVDLKRTISMGEHSISIEKEFNISTGALPGITASYRLSGGKDLFFGIELNFNLLSEHDKKRYFKIPGVAREESYLDSMGVSKNIKSFSLLDEYKHFRINIKMDEPGNVIRYPVYTVSQSEKGFEKNYQGCAIVLLHKLEDKQSQFKVEIIVS